MYVARVWYNITKYYAILPSVYNFFRVQILFDVTNITQYAINLPCDM